MFNLGATAHVYSRQCTVFSGVLQEPDQPEQILCQPIADKHETSTSFNSTKMEENKEKQKSSVTSILQQQGQKPSYAERKTCVLNIKML